MSMDMIGNFIASKKDLFVMIWSREKGWTLVSEGCEYFKDIDAGSFDIEKLQEYVIETNKDAYRVFCDKVKSISKGVWAGQKTDENRVSVVVRMNADGKGYSFYHVNCWLERSSDDIERMMFMVYQSSIEEAYRINLAEITTNDRTPAGFMNQAKMLIGQHPERKWAIIQFDVAKFKVINERYGESMGDEILTFFVDSLKVICNSEQLYVRLSADSFMILTAYETKDDIYKFIDTLDSELLGYKGIKYKIVYGVCPVDDIRHGLRKYGDSAAVARQSIKMDALTHVAFFEDNMKIGILSRKDIEDNMEDALKNGEFVMYLQPKYSISQNKVIGAEALIRWIHPEKGLIPPMEFVPFFEQNGFVVKMDRFIWEEACKLIRKWIDNNEPVYPISVNVSRRHFNDANFTDYIEQLIEKYRIPKHYLELEITETVEEKQISDGINVLKGRGYTLLVDDFGSGYSSLNTLKDTNFDVIKMDRIFLQNFIGSQRGKSIVNHTIQMTRDIGLEIVAEGVENAEQAQFLNECGCDAAQGFFYAKPMTVSDFEKHVKSV